MSFYANLAATARRLLTQFGTDVTLTRTTTGEYDPATGSASQTTTTYTGKGARFDYTQREIDGTMIRVGDQRVYLEVDGFVMPQTGDTLTLGGRVYQVVAARSVDPALTAVLYDVQVRGV